MFVWPEILRRAAYLGRRSQFDRELDDEIRFHIETRAEELEADGIPTKAALEQARREFGPRARATEDTRSAWQIAWLEDLWRDLGFALRMSAKSPGFTAVAILSLALGVGANCAMFIFVDALLLHPLGVPRPGEVITLHETSPQMGTSGLSYRDYLDVRGRTKSFDGLLAFTSVTIGFAAHAGATPHTKDGQLVTGNYFDVLGVPLALGRGFLPQEDQVPGRDPVVILSHALWASEFNSDIQAVGKHVWLGGKAFEVVGVTPAKFATIDEDLNQDDPDYYVPLMMAPSLAKNADTLEKRESKDFAVLGRLRPGVTIEQSQAEVAALSASLGKQYPETSSKRGMVVQTIRNYRTEGFGGFTGALVMLLAAAVLVVACANVAGLLTSRASGRAHEIAVRLTVGAGRMRLIRQLLTESLLLAAAGGVAGIAIGCIPVLLLKRLVSEISPEDSGALAPLLLDTRVVIFSMTVAFLSVLLFGLVPAFQTTRTDLSSAMKGGKGVSRGRGLLRNRMWGRNFLVTSQVAISVFLLTASGFIYVGLRTLADQISDSGFPADSVLAMNFDPVVAHYKDSQARQFYDRLLERLRFGAATQSVTLASEPQSIPIQPEGYARAVGSNGADSDSVSGIQADPNFFDALRIPIVLGRSFRVTEGSGDPDVAVVNEAFAKFYWPGQDPVGRRIRVTEGKARWVQVVGVAAIKQYEGMISIPPPKLMFLSTAQSSKQIPMTLHARFGGDWTSRVRSLQVAVRDLDPVQAVPEIHRWGARLFEIRKFLQLARQIIAAIGATGILLALVGLYGLVSYDVSTKTREIGIRMALGAERSSLLRRVLRHGVVLAVCGTASGLILNYGVDRILFTFIPPNTGTGTNSTSNVSVTWDFGNREQAVLVIAVLILTMLAAYIPARRAASVDPSVALRCE